MIKTKQYLSWREDADEPHAEKVYRVIEPNNRSYYVKYTSEGKHYLALLTDMYESYIHADVDRFSKIKIMLDWVRPSVMKHLYRTWEHGTAARHLIKTYGDGVLVDMSFKREYDKKYPISDKSVLYSSYESRFVDAIRAPKFNS